MSPRRGFLALVGGAGAFTGSVLFRKAAAVPTLILPSQLAIDVQPVADASTEMQAFHTVKADLSDALFLDWLEAGLRMAEDFKPDGGIFRAGWAAATGADGRVPPPPERWVGPGGRTPHEDAYVRQNVDDLLASLNRSQAWSAALPIRRGGRA